MCFIEQWRIATNTCRLGLMIPNVLHRLGESPGRFLRTEACYTQLDQRSIISCRPLDCASSTGAAFKHSLCSSVSAHN